MDNLGLTIWKHTVLNQSKTARFDKFDAQWTRQFIPTAIGEKCVKAWKWRRGHGLFVEHKNGSMWKSEYTLPELLHQVKAGLVKEVKMKGAGK